MQNIYNLNSVSAVVDNNILVDLFELEELELLFVVIDIVIIPEVIFNDELEQEVKDIIEPYDYEITVIDSAIGLGMYQTLTNDRKYRNLSSYDKIAISIAKEKLYYLSSNDGLVRKTCSEHDINYSGILGILGRAYKLEKITREHLYILADKLKGDETSCYIKGSIIEAFLEDIVN